MAIGNALKKIFIIVLIAVVIGAVASTAIGAVTNVNQTGWSASIIALWYLVPMVVVFAIIFIVLEAAGIKIMED